MLEGMRGMTPISDAELFYKLSLARPSNDPAALARSQRPLAERVVPSQEQIREGAARTLADFMQGGNKDPRFVSAYLRRGEDWAAGVSS